MSKRTLREVLKSPTHKELQAIEALGKKVLCMFQRNYTPTFKRVTVSRRQVNELPDGKYVVYNLSTGEKLELVKKVTSFVEIFISGELEAGDWVFTHPKLFPASVIEIELPLDVRLY